MQSLVNSNWPQQGIKMETRSAEAIVCISGIMLQVALLNKGDVPKKGDGTPRGYDCELHKG